MGALVCEESRDNELLDTDDFEDNDNADIGGECGGRGMEAGSTLAFRTCLAAFEGPSGGVNV